MLFMWLSIAAIRLKLLKCLQYLREEQAPNKAPSNDASAPIRTDYWSIKA